MGLAASQARLFMLVARKSDLELQLQFINQARMQIANMMLSLFTQNGNLDPETTYAKQLQGRIAAIQQWDKMLELHAQRIDTQHKTCETEIEAVKKVMDKNIAMSFKLMS